MFTYTNTFCRYVPAFPGSRGVTLSCLEPEIMSTHYNPYISMSFKKKRITWWHKSAEWVLLNRKQRTRCMLKFAPGLVAFNHQKTDSLPNHVSYMFWSLQDSIMTPSWSYAGKCPALFPNKQLVFFFVLPPQSSAMLYWLRLCMCN